VLPTVEYRPAENNASLHLTVYNHQVLAARCEMLNVPKYICTYLVVGMLADLIVVVFMR
jgi:hypothetical protein